MYHNPIFSKFLCMPTLKVTNVIGNFSLSFLSQEYTTDEHRASVAKEKNTIFKFWGANMTLSVSTDFHPHSVSAREGGKWKKGRFSLHGRTEECIVFSITSKRFHHRLCSTFWVTEFSIFHLYNLGEVTFVKVPLQKWAFSLDVCKFYSTYAVCNLPIGISICKMEIKCVCASLQN